MNSELPKPNEARAFWTVAPGKGEIRSAMLAERAGDECLVRTLFSAISRGTESLVFQGRVPALEFERMRAPFQDGDFPFPVKYGYINVGTVEAGPAGMAGRVVFCLFPHQDRYIVPASALTVVPEAIPAGRAVLAANLETAINAVWDAGPRPGDRIAVIGAGAVGCLVAWVVRQIPGCEVELIDIDPAKAPAADSLGVRFAVPDSATPEVDLVIHASASADGLELAMRLAAFEARIVELSWFGSVPVQVQLGGAFHSRRLRLIASQVGHIAGPQRSRWTHRRRMDLVMRLLADAAMDTLITGESRFDDLPEVMARIASGREPAICHRIVY